MVDLIDVQDARFPDLSSILDTDLVRDVLLSHADIWREDVEFVDFKRWDVRYKPGRECAAHYRFFFRKAGETRVRHQAITVELPSPTFDACRSNAALSEKYRGLQETLISEPFVELSELNATAYPFPIDPYLPSLLEALDGKLMKQRFSELPKVKGARVHRVRPRLVSYNLGARATILYEVDYREGRSGEISHKKVIGKLNTHKILSRELANNFALWRTTHDKFSQAEPLGSFENLGVALQSHLEGRPLGELLDQPEFNAYLTKTAEALAALHSARFPLEQMRDGERLARSIRRRRNVLKAAHPDLRKRVRALTSELADRVERETTVIAPTHGDFHHTNILAGADNVSIIDFDEMAMGDPASDAGRFIASLSIPSLRIFGDLRGPEKAKQHFLQPYLKKTGIDIERVLLFEAASYLTSAATAFRLQRENWQAHIEMLIDRSEKILSQLSKASLSEKEPAPLSVAEKKKWAGDGRYVGLLAKQGLYNKLDAEVHEAELLDRRHFQTRSEFVYKLSGVKDERQWQQRAYGYMRNQGSARRMLRDLEAYRDAVAGQEDRLVVPSPIGSSQPLRLLLYTYPRSSALSRLTADDWSLALTQQLATSLAHLHNTSVRLQRSRSFEKVIAMYSAGAKSQESQNKILSLSQELNSHGEDTVVTLEGFNTHDIAFADGQLILCDPTKLVTGVPVFAVAEVATWLCRNISQETKKEFCKTYFAIRPEDREGFNTAMKIVCLSSRHRSNSKEPTKPSVPKTEKAVRAPSKTAQQELYRTIVRACQGKVAIVGEDIDTFISYAKNKDLEVTAIDPQLNTSLNDKFDTIVLLGYLEHWTKDQETQALAQLDPFFAPYGKLICCVPNEHFTPTDLGIRRFSERELEKALGAYSRVRPLVTQPLKWIVQTATKLRRPSEAIAARYDFMANLCHGRVLDLGCGPGLGTAEIAAAGYEVIGLDISERKIKLAREYHPGLDFRVANIRELPDDLGQFDTVVLAEVIEHVESAMGEEFLDMAWQHVGPHGRLVVSVPNLTHVPHKNHLTEFSWQSLSDLLAKFGAPQVVTDQPYRWLLMYVDRKN